jgi:large subunit ribosomal protein L10
MSSSELKQVSIPEAKSKQVSELVQLAKKYKTIGLTKLDGISSNVLQNIKKSLRGSTVIKVSKNTLKRLALEEAIKSRPDLEKLDPHITSSLAFVFSNDNPFSLMKFFDKNRVNVAAKPGQIVHQEVWVNAGPTDFNPGPIISEFNSAGIRTSVQQGKVNIQKDVKILSSGDTVTESTASIMSKLGIKPIRAGISLNIAIDEEGTLFTENELSINEEDIMDQLLTANQDAFNLSVKLGYPTKQNIQILLNKTHQEAMNLSLEAGYPTKETIVNLLAITNLKAKALESKTK